MRPAPSQPEFVHVAAGDIRFVPRASPIIRPRTYEEIDSDNDGLIDSIEEVVTPALVIEKRDRAVQKPFSIARNEITNRQYLAFLVDAVTEEQEFLNLRPERFWRPNPFTGRDIIFRGVHGDPAKITWLFDAGRENLPVRGVTEAQTRAYSAWLSRKQAATFRLPTAAEFIRAGRGDTDSPYPWGTSTGRLDLICDGRADDWDRAVSLARFLDASEDSIAGLCGNVLELVRAPGKEQRFWLAGGCFDFPAEACTLDDFLEVGWKVVHLPIEGGENPFALASLTGFRVVREEVVREEVAR